MILVAGALLLGGCGTGSSGFDAAKPDGWRDDTLREEARSGTDFEAVYKGPQDGDVRASITILRTGASEGATLGDITERGRRNVERAYGTTPSAPVPTRLDGTPAMRFDYEAEDGRVRQVGALRDGTFYLVSFTAAAHTFDIRLPALEEILRSWRWEE